ncbi:MAG TPA: argininosuccinate lyase, partial [Actinomycetota bacterium]|nr:argininosuccinate lyase [Actinomycetota bacterium]
MSPLWSGRFSGEPAQELRRLADSIAFDVRLWPYDIAVTRAHAAGLVEAGLLTADELLLIEGACDELAGLFENGEVEIHPDDEDIHSVVERFLTTRLGDTGARIHAGRSRNDLVATDMRLWAKEAVVEVARGVHGVQEALYRLARENDSAIMPGYTHLQRAQPISVAHHFLAHAFAVARDFERLISAYRRADVCPLGAAAFSGTSLPVNPKATALRLGFRRTFDNAADAVSSRDFLVEFLSALAMVAVNLSRIGEEIVLWTSSEFGFAALDDTYSTGSSIMPQKRNPDPAELVRAKSARVTADLVTLLGVLKGLP